MFEMSEKQKAFVVKKTPWYSEHLKVTNPRAHGGEAKNKCACTRVPTSSGNHGKPRKSLKKIHAWKNNGI